MTDRTPSESPEAVPVKPRRKRLGDAISIVWLPSGLTRAAAFLVLIVVLLGAAALLSFVFGGALEGGAIVAVLVINAAIGFATELRAVTSMEALRELEREEGVATTAEETDRRPDRSRFPGLLTPQPARRSPARCRLRYDGGDRARAS